MSAKWSASEWPPRPLETRGPRVDWRRVLVWLGAALGPWLILAATLVYLAGWRPW